MKRTSMISPNPPRWPANVDARPGHTHAVKAHVPKPIAIWLDGVRRYFPFTPEGPGQSFSRQASRAAGRALAKGLLLRHPRTGVLAYHKAEV